MAAEKNMTVIQKHPLGIRWNHWINFPILAIMTWSGLCIYWANADYGIPQTWLDALGLQFRLAQGLSWHWPFAVIFTINGFFYFLFLLFTGHWQHLIISSTKYNPTQRLAYFIVFLFGVIMVGTGFAIYKPTQLNWLLTLFGGYTIARYLHFYVTLALVLFFIVHVIQVIRAGWNTFRAMITGLENKNENS